MKFIVLSLAFAFALQVKAAEIKLATITTDTVTDVTVFYLETNPGGEAQAMRYVTTVESGQITEDVHATVNEILNGGVVVEEMENREIIRLFLEKFDASTGGDVKLNFLANGVTGSKGNFYLKLTKVKDAFVLTDTTGKVINSIFIHGNWSRLLRRWIGVNKITTSFEKKNQ